MVYYAAAKTLSGVCSVATILHGRAGILKLPFKMNEVYAVKLNFE